MAKNHQVNQFEFNNKQDTKNLPRNAGRVFCLRNIGVVCEVSPCHPNVFLAFHLEKADTAIVAQAEPSRNSKIRDMYSIA